MSSTIYYYKVVIVAHVGGQFTFYQCAKNVNLLDLKLLISKSKMAAPMVSGWKCNSKCYFFI